MLYIIIEFWFKNELPVYFLIDRKCNKTNLISLLVHFVCPCSLQTPHVTIPLFLF